MPICYKKKEATFIPTYIFKLLNI